MDQKSAPPPKVENSGAENPGAENPGANEGEGNKTAARHYNDATRKFAESGQVEPKAKEAEKAVESPENAELKRAEDIGKQHSHGEDPALRRK